MASVSASLGELRPPVSGQPALALERAIASRRGFTSSSGLLVPRAECDWLLVQEDKQLHGVYVSCIVDMHGVIYCTCADGLKRMGCDHVLAAGECLDSPHEPRRATRSKNQGARNGRAKLSAAAVAEIRAKAGTHNQAELARRFGVARSTVSDIACGRRWRSDAVSTVAEAPTTLQRELHGATTWPEFWAVAAQLAEAGAAT